MGTRRTQRVLAMLVRKAKVLWGEQLTEELLDGTKTHAARLAAALRRNAGATRRALARRLRRARK